MFYRNRRAVAPFVGAMPVVISVVLSGCGGATGEEETRDKATDNVTPMLSIDASSVNEGNRSNTELKIPVSLSASPSSDVELTYSFVDESATNGVDYVAEGGTVIIPSGARRGEIVVTVQSDATHEPDETFAVHLESATNAEISTRGKSALITIRNDDDPPEIAFNTEQQSVSETVGSALVPVVLSAESGFSVTATVKFSGTALNGGDYELDGEQVVTFAPGETLQNIELLVHQDNIPEGGETVFVSLEQIQNAALTGSELQTHSFIILGDTSLNDTGLTTYSDGISGGVVFEPASHPGQDASFGLDADGSQSTADGHAGFSFTKLDKDGNPLPSSSQTWICTRDNVTGLVWENKMPDMELSSDPENGTLPNSQQWRAGNFVYGWRNNDETDNGGNAGRMRANNYKLDVNYPVMTEFGYCAFTFSKGRRFDLYCDSKAYVDEMNLKGTCGFDDWRMPEINELRSLANYDMSDGTMRPDANFFSTLKTNVRYLSGTSSADNEVSAWCYDFQNGEVELCQKAYHHGFMAVRSKK
jgi:hypothetical protein